MKCSLSRVKRWQQQLLRDAHVSDDKNFQKTEIIVSYIHVLLFKVILQYTRF